MARPYCFLLVFVAASTLLAARLSTAQEKAAGPAGDWHLTWRGVLETQYADLHIEEHGSALEGTIDGKHMTGTVRGSRIVFSFDPAAGMTLVFKGRIDGNQMSGTTGGGRAWRASR